MGKRRRRSRGGGGGGGSGIMGRLSGGIAIVMGTVALLIALIMYYITLDNLDAAYTSAATYTEQVGLQEVMGIWPLVLFLIFMSVGLAAIGMGAYVQAKRALSGQWMDIFLGVVMGTVAVVIATIMNTTIQSQLHTIYLDASNVSKIANIANFAGLLDTMTVFGMVIFVMLMGAGIAQLVAGGVGGFRKLTGRA